MITKIKDTWKIPAICCALLLCTWAWYLNAARATSAPPDVTITVDAPTASPGIVGVGTASAISVNAHAFYPTASNPEAAIGSPVWTFAWVSAQVVATQPSASFDWSKVAIADPSTYTKDLVAAPTSSSNPSPTAPCVANATFNFTPKQPGYWLIVVSASVTFPENMNGAFLKNHVGGPTNSPSAGLSTLTAVQLDIIWKGEDINDTSGHSVLANSSIKDKSCYMVVGKCVMVKATLSPADLSISSPGWTVPHTVGGIYPGCAIVGFNTNPTGCWDSTTNMSAPATGTLDILADHTSDMLQMSPPTELDFYWSMISSASENDDVKYSITVRDPVTGTNIILSSKTTFVLEAPTILTWSPTMESPTIDGSSSKAPGQPVLHLGDSSGPVGINIHYHADPPSHASGRGSVNWVQIVRNSSSGFEFSGEFSNFWRTLTPDMAGPPSVDTTFPYGFGSPVAPADFADSPGIKCNLYDGIYPSVSVYRHDDFDCYLVYKPDGTNTIYVPIYLQQWSWGGQGLLTGSLTWSWSSPAAWTLSGQYSTPGYSGFPGWYNFSGNIQPLHLQ